MYVYSLLYIIYRQWGLDAFCAENIAKSRCMTSRQRSQINTECIQIYNTAVQYRQRPHFGILKQGGTMTLINGDFQDEIKTASELAGKICELANLNIKLLEIILDKKVKTFYQEEAAAPNTRDEESLLLLGRQVAVDCERTQREDTAAEGIVVIYKQYTVYTFSVKLEIFFSLGRGCSSSYHGKREQSAARQDEEQNEDQGVGFYFFAVLFLIYRNERHLIPVRLFFRCSRDNQLASKEAYKFKMSLPEVNLHFLMCCKNTPSFL